MECGVLSNTTALRYDDVLQVACNAILMSPIAVLLLAVAHSIIFLLENMLLQQSRAIKHLVLSG